MSLENVVNEILEKARKQAAEIEHEGKREPAGILQKTRDELAAKEKEASVSTARLKEAIENKEMASAKLLVSKELQEIRKQLITASYEKAKDRIANLPDKQKEDLLAILAKQAEKELETTGTVYVNKADSSLAKKICKGAAIKTTEDIFGGAIFESSNGSMRVDFSFNQLLENAKNKHLKELAAMLFEK